MMSGVLDDSCAHPPVNGTVYVLGVDVEVLFEQCVGLFLAVQVKTGCIIGCVEFKFKGGAGFNQAVGHEVFAERLGDIIQLAL